jgi:hypothetical protein
MGWLSTAQLNASLDMTSSSTLWLGHTAQEFDALLGIALRLQLPHLGKDSKLIR